MTNETSDTDPIILTDCITIPTTKLSEGDFVRKARNYYDSVEMHEAEVVITGLERVIHSLVNL